MATMQATPGRQWQGPEKQTHACLVICARQAALQNSATAISVGTCHENQSGAYWPTVPGRLHHAHSGSTLHSGAGARADPAPSNPAHSGTDDAIIYQPSYPEQTSPHRHGGLTSTTASPSCRCNYQPAHYPASEPSNLRHSTYWRRTRTGRASFQRERWCCDFSRFFPPGVPCSSPSPSWCGEWQAQAAERGAA